MLGRISLCSNASLKSKNLIKRQNKRRYAGQSVLSYSMVDNVAQPVVNKINNLHVVSQVKQNSPLLTVGITIASGAVNENDSTSGISRFIAALLLEGNSSRINGTLREELRSLGTVTQVAVDRETTRLHVRCFPEDVQRVVAVLGDALQNRHFNQENFEYVRNKELQAIDAAADDLNIMMQDHLHNAAFQGTPLERSPYGTSETVGKFSQEDVAKYMDTHFTGPSIVVSAVGAVESGKVVDSVANATSGLSQKATAPRQDNVDFVGSEVRIRDDDVHGCHVVYALQGGKIGENKEAYQIIEELTGSFDKNFGGLNNNGSELSEALATERLVYNYESFNHFYKTNGIIGVKGFFTTNTELELDTSSDFVLKMYQRIGKTMTANDLKRAQNNLISAALFRFDDDLSLSDDLGREALLTEKVSSLRNTIERIQNVSHSDIKAVTRELDDTCPVIVSFGQTETLPDYTVLRNRTFWTLW